MTNKIAELQEQIDDLRDMVGQTGISVRPLSRWALPLKEGLEQSQVYFDPADKQGTADIIRNTYDLFAFMAVEDDMVRQAFEKDRYGAVLKR